MKQTCLCQYLGVTCKHPDTFLHIPLSIRRRIYLYAGVITGTYTVYPNYGKLDGDGNSTTPPESYDVTYALTMVCPQIRSEVEAIILSQNILVYTDDDVDDGLDFLDHLDPYACSMLRDVYVHLFVQPYSYDYKPTPEPLKRERIGMWQWAIKNILSHAKPKQLRLHVICDTPDAEKKAAVLQPLYKFPGVLLELELRLESNREDKMLPVIAREIALHVQGQDPLMERPFRFFDLPAEVRQNIFEYTNLVAPHRKVHWSHKFGFRGGFVFCESNGTVCREENIHHESKLADCGAFSENFTRSFCMMHHGSYSSRCNHRLSPLPLLLTCRAMYEEAIDFFYASNRVVILPNFSPRYAIFARVPSSEDILPEGNPLGEYLEHDRTKLFVEKVGFKALKLIRNIEIVFPQIDSDSDLTHSHPAVPGC